MRAALLVLLTSATVATGAERATAPDTRVLDAWLKRQPSIRSLEARFTQERLLPALKQQVITEGRLAFQRPGKLRWELGEPAATLAISDGTKLTLIEVAAKLARRLDADSPQARQFTLLASDAFQDAASFRRSFEVTAQQRLGAIHRYSLRPLDRRLRSKLPAMHLEVDPERNEVRAIEIELPDRSRIRSVFREIRINPVLDAARFQYPLEGFKVAG